MRDGLERHAQALGTELSAVAAGGPRPTDPADRLDAALLRAEVRRAAAGMSEQELELLYRQGPAVVRAALEELPRIEAKNGAVSVRPFISPELRLNELLQGAVVGHLSHEEQAELNSLQREAGIEDEAE